MRMAGVISSKHLGNSMGSKGNQMGDFGSPLSTGGPCADEPQKAKQEIYI